MLHKFWRKVRDGWLSCWRSRPGARSEGFLAEQRAADWLVRQRGMQWVAQNWRNPADRREEIDLVLRDGAALVFVEVKARRADALVPGFHAVGPAKRAVLRRAVRAYLQAAGGFAQAWRFDIVEVETAPHRPAESWPVRHFVGVNLFSRHVRR